LSARAEPTKQSSLCRERENLVGPQGAVDRYMVRPERRNVLAGESPARVSAGAPGSRLQPGGEIRLGQAECQKLFLRKGEQTSGPQQSVNAIASSNTQPKGVWESRAAHVTAKATNNIIDRNGCWISPGSQATARWDRRREPTWQPSRGKDRAYKVGRLKVRGAGRESEVRSTEEGLQENTLEGTMPATANTPNEKVRELQRKLCVCAKQSRTRRFHALYDRIYRSDVLCEAWRRVRSNRGAAGVDAETIQAIVVVDGVEITRRSCA